MTATDYALLVAVFAGVLLLSKWRDWPPFQITKKPAERLSPQLLEQYRSEIVWNAMQKPKRKLRAGQSRRPF